MLAPNGTPQQGWHRCVLCRSNGGTSLLRPRASGRASRAGRSNFEKWPLPCLFPHGWGGSSCEKYVAEIGTCANTKNRLLTRRQSRLVLARFKQIFEEMDQKTIQDLYNTYTKRLQL